MDKINRYYSPLPFSLQESLSELTDNEYGKFVRAIVNYDRYGELPNFNDKLLSVLFKSAQYDIDRITEAQSDKSINNKYSTYCREQKKKNAPILSRDEYIEQHRMISNDIERYRTIKTISNDTYNKVNKDNKVSKDNKDNINNTISEIPQNNSADCNSSEHSVRSLCINIPLKDGTNFVINEDDIAKFQNVYSYIDCAEECKSIALWNEANPSKRKTKAGVNKHIVNWLNRNNSNAKKQTLNNNIEDYSDISRYDGKESMSYERIFGDEI